LGGVCAGQLLFLCFLPYRGYFWTAIRRIMAYLLLAIGVQWTLGLLIVAAAEKWLGAKQTLPLCAATGLFVVVIPSWIDKISPKFVRFNSLRTGLVGVLGQIKIFTARRFLEEIVQLRREDNYDCQNSLGWWNLQLNEKQIARRIRILYEGLKLEISNSLRKPEFMGFDIDVSSGQKFYLLVDYLGRKEFRRRLQRSPAKLPPGYSWKGEERRRKRGTIADRRLPDSNAGFPRRSDNEQLLRLISKGDACADGLRSEVVDQPEVDQGV